MTQAPAGWYPDSQGNMRYWDGQTWTGHMAEPVAVIAQRNQIAEVIGLVALILAIIGTCIAGFTSVSLLSGMNTVWTGMAIAIGGAALALFAPGGVRKAIKVTCVVLAVIAVICAVYQNHQLDVKRQQLTNILNGG